MVSRSRSSSNKQDKWKGKPKKKLPFDNSRIIQKEEVKENKRYKNIIRIEQ